MRKILEKINYYKKNTEEKSAIIAWQLYLQKQQERQN